MIFGLTLVLSNVPAWIVQISGLRLLPDAPPTATSIAVRVGQTLLLLALHAWSDMTIQKVTLDSLMGERGTLRGALVVGARKAMIVLPLGLIVNWGVWIFPFLTIRTTWKFHSLIEFATFLTGLVTLSLWGVTDPVVVAEDQKLFGAMARSQSLLNVGRWRYLIVFCLYRLAATIPFWAFPIFFRSAVYSPAAKAFWTYGYLALGVPAAALTAAFIVFSGAYYRQLSRIQDGVAPGEVASVFD